MHLKPEVAVSPFHKHFSSLLENELTGWNEFQFKNDSKSFAVNPRTQVQNFLHRRKSNTGQHKKRVACITSRYMDRSLYVPKENCKRVVRKNTGNDFAYSFIRKKSISQLEKLMKILENRTASQSVDLPKLPKQANTKPLKSQDSKQEPTKIFSTTLLKFYKLRNP
jgi:hypothetical protein